MMYDQGYFSAAQHHQQHHHQQQQQSQHHQSQIGYQNVNQKIHRSVSNSNVSHERPADCHVEYEVSMPVPIIRHPPYHSLWNLHQW